MSLSRRRFVALLGAATAWPLGVKAQQNSPPRGPGDRPWLIGALVNATKAQSDIDFLGPFVQGLTKLGYVGDRHYRIEARYTDDDDSRYPALAAQIVALAPDLILANANGAVALHQLTQTIPVIASLTSDETTTVLVGNRARPIGNVTGITTDNAALTGKLCDLALELLPAATRVGVLVNVAVPTGSAGPTHDVVLAAAKSRGFTPVFADISRAEVSAGFRSLAEQRVDVVIVGGGFGSDRAWVAQNAAQVRLPAIYNEQGFVELGGLISYGFSRAATFMRLAQFADRIFRGSPVADTPAEATTDYFMALNAKVAKSLRLTIPPSILFRVDEVIQ